MSPSKSSEKSKAQVSPELEGFVIHIDSFGEIKTNFEVDRINEFLNNTVDDKKLRDRNDLKKPASQNPKLGKRS